ncbi:hypothetical protein [Microcystis phage Mel-JY01]
MNLKIDSINDVKKLVIGEHESQNKLQVGYDGEKKISEKREIGDRWFDDDGVEYEQKDGFVVKLGKQWQQELREYLNNFPNCPKEKCTCEFPKRIDEKMKKIHGKCFDCVLKFESDLRKQKKFDEYEKEKILSNAKSWLIEAERDKNLIAEEMSKMEFTNDFGIEKWNVPVSKEQYLEKINKEFDEFKEKFITRLEQELSENFGENNGEKHDS